MAEQQVTTQQQPQTPNPGAMIAANYMNQAKELAKEYGINDKLFSDIKRAAENNRAMYEPSEQKNAVYNALQSYFTEAIKDKAVLGKQMDSTNQWKQSVYDQYGQNHLISEGALFDRLNQQSDSKLQSMNQWLQQATNSTIDAQKAQLQQGLDQQLLEIDKALQEAVNAGQMSIRDAQTQYEQAKQQIYQQAYNDSELTNLSMYDRGIQNSAQSVGLMQGDAYRRDSLLNQNLTTRDQQINAINNQLAQLQSGAAMDKAFANASFNNQLAGAIGQANATMNSQMAEMSFSEMQRLAQQEFQATMSSKDREFTKEQQAQQHQFDLEKLSVQQKYTLEQMAKSFGYDLQKMSVQQQYQLAQMAEAFGYDMTLQQSQQQFQASQNAADRNLQRELLEIKNRHDFSMLNEQQRLDLEKYDVELQRKLSLYTPGTKEYELLNKEADWAYDQAVKESTMHFAAEINAAEIQNILKQYPTKMPDPSDKKAVDEYNKKVEGLNKKLEQVMGGKGGEAYYRDLAKSKGKSEEETNSFLNALKGSSYLETLLPNLP